MKSAGSIVWNFIDDLWKYLRWVMASAAVLRVYEKSENTIALIVALLLGTIAAAALAARTDAFILNGVTEKGLKLNDCLAVLLAIGIFIFSLGFGVAVGMVVTALLIQAGA